MPILVLSEDQIKYAKKNEYYNTVILKEQKDKLDNDKKLIIPDIDNKDIIEKKYITPYSRDNSFDKNISNRNINESIKSTERKKSIDKKSNKNIDNIKNSKDKSSINSPKSNIKESPIKTKQLDKSISSNKNINISNTSDNKNQSKTNKQNKSMEKSLSKKELENINKNSSDQFKESSIYEEDFDQNASRFDDSKISDDKSKNKYQNVNYTGNPTEDQYDEFVNDEDIKDYEEKDTSFHRKSSSYGNDKKETKKNESNIYASSKFQNDNAIEEDINEDINSVSKESIHNSKNIKQSSKKSSNSTDKYNDFVESNKVSNLTKSSEIPEDIHAYDNNDSYY